MTNKSLSKRDKVRSAGVVIVRKENDQYLFLLLRLGEYIDFPKGQIELGENQFDAAIRETKEETTITADELDFKWGKDFYTTEPYKKGTKTATYYLAETERESIELPINPEIGKPEHDSYSWLTYKQAKASACSRVGRVLNWAMGKIDE